MEVLIVSGGSIDTNFLLEYIKDHKTSTIIAVDKGLEILYDFKIMPQHIVGDLDSVNFKIFEYYKNVPDIKIHKYLPEKDFTDTDIALDLAISLKASHITIIGALGKRADHSLANIHILKNALDKNIFCEILDKNNKIYLINKKTIFEKKKMYGKYISFIPLTSSVTCLTLNGFKYPLESFNLSVGKSLGVSNEIINDTATVDFENGILIVIESKD